MPSLTIDIKQGSPLANRILHAVRDRVQASKTAYEKRHTEWRKQEDNALAYLHEREIDRQRRYKRELGGKPELTTIKIPYSYGVLMASHSYWATVFMGRSPVNQFSGRHGESAQQIQALEALIDYQANVGEMLVPWYLWLLDVGKFGLGVVSIDWVDEYSIVSRIEEKPILFAGLEIGKGKKQKVNSRVPGYSGNRITNIRPYDFYPDPRVPARFFQKGEFCAFYVEMGWNTILKRADQGYYTQDAVDKLRKNMPTGEGVYAGVDNSGVTDSGRVQGSDRVDLPSNVSFDIDKDLSNNFTHRKKSNWRNSLIKGYECCIELVPRDWGLGGNSYPEKWMFTTTLDYTTVLGAQPLGANHDRFPAAVLEYEPEGYALNSRSIGEVLEPINDTMDWLLNSHLYNVRKALNTQVVVDPSQVILADLENPLPGGAIRMSPAAYGRDPRAVLNQLPITDVTRGHLSDLSAIQSIGQRTVGVNEQLMGHAALTGRRSAAEVRTSTGFGVNRLKTVSEFFSAMGWAPMAQMLVQNSQQYYDAEKKFRIVGQLAQQAGQEFIDVTPEKILGFYDFVAVDGTQPIDRIAQAQLWNNLFAQLRNFPQVLQQYDMGKIFEWVAQLAGLKNISQFRIDLQPDALLAQQAQQGNVVPLGGRAAEQAVPGQASAPGQGTGAAGDGSAPATTNVSGGGPNYA